MFRFVRTVRAARLRAAIEAERKFYSSQRSPVEIRAYQLQAFNGLWSNISQHVPRYAEAARNGKLPRHFSSWEEFRGAIPISDRAFVRKHLSELSDTRQRADFVRTTGGSTSEPLQLPSWRSELAYSNADAWLARSWFGIDPGDKLFLIWGHSHLLGKGVLGKVNAFRRRIKDALLGYHRWSAYDLGEMAMRHAGEALLRFRPAWVMGYSVALDQLTQVNVDLAKKFADLKLKMAIATAESFPRSNSAERIARTLGCNVAMEYGAVETGAVAHQRRDGRFQVFWRHWFIEGAPSRDIEGTFELFLTSLYPRKFPLLRYRVGDLISDDPNSEQFDQTFSRVIGRCNDYIALNDGVKIHSEAFTHAVKECAGIDRFQVVQNSSGKIYFRYTGPPRDSAVEGEIQRRLSIVHPELRGVRFECVNSLGQTISGKSRTIVRES